MNVLTLEDLLEVSMFKCKICCRRLQCPVLQVGLFGNICGICNDRSVFTDIIPNVDVETLLAKLQVPCNFKERGCTYYGSYYNTCEHERECEFRDKICPFAYLGICDNVLGDFHEISAHVLSYHEDYVVDGGINCQLPVLVQNPTETNSDLFYLLNWGQSKFLLRTWIDAKEECIFYSFYYFKNNIHLESIKISFNIKLKNTIFNITGENGHIQPESAISSAYDTDNAFRIPVAILKSLNSLKYVGILITADEKPAEALTEERSSKNQSVWIRCPLCSKIKNTIKRCNCCHVRSCTNCTTISTCCSYSEYGDHSWSTINLSTWELVYETPCQNAGCNHLLQPNEYKQHKEVCMFKKHSCPLSSCIWDGLVEDLAAHMYEAHPKSINKNTCSVKTSEIIFFVRDRDVFKQTFDLSSSGDLSVTIKKLNSPDWDNSYKWEIRLKRKDKPMMMVITDLCTEEGHKKTVNVKNYVNANELMLYADINNVDECVLPNQKVDVDVSEQN